MPVEIVGYEVCEAGSPLMGSSRKNPHVLIVGIVKRMKTEDLEDEKSSSDWAGRHFIYS